MGHEKLAVGQRFEENDSRFTRIIEVVAIKGHQVRIKTVFKDGAKIVGRITTASKDRFYKNSGGYRRLYGKCNKCQIKAGGVIPKGGHRGITVSEGTCSECLTAKTWLVPECDYHWPKEGRKAIWD